MQNSFTLNGENTSLRKLDQRLQELLCSLDSTNLFEIYLVLEELISNIYIHGSQNKQVPVVDVKLQINSDKNILITVTDTGRGFNPTQKIEMDRCESLEKKKVGGLGLFLIQNMADKMDYARVGGKNSVLITKNVIKPVT